MFANFRGFHLIEEIHKRNKERAAKGHNTNLAIVIKLTLVLAATFGIWLAPADSFGMENLTVVEQRIIGIFVFALVN